jgi:hypothetical protein
MNKPTEILAAPNPALMLYWLVTGQLWRLGVGEDPNWGKRPIDQIAVQSTIFELSHLITDAAVKEKVQAALAVGLTKTSEKLAKAA